MRISYVEVLFDMPKVYFPDGICPLFSIKGCEEVRTSGEIVVVSDRAVE